MVEPIDQRLTMQDHKVHAKSNGEPLKRFKQMNAMFSCKKVIPDGHSQLDVGRPRACCTNCLGKQ